MKTTASLLALALIVLAPGVKASPWAEPGSFALRADIERLADAGVITTPVSTWPMPWSDLRNAIDRADGKKLAPDVQAALLRVRRHLTLAMVAGKTSVRLQAANDTAVTRHFDDNGRSNGEVTYSGEVDSANWAGRLQLSAQADASDHDDHRYLYEGSFVSAETEDWSLGLGQLDRWWGPTQDAGLILSDNARPVPGVFIQRGHTNAFETPWLSWLGPWQLVSFMGRLEDDRDHAKTRLWGLRIDIRPFERLELGMSRTAQWGGAGRPQGFSTFARVLEGRDNPGSNGVTKENEAGNQLGGFDARWNWWRSDEFRSTVYAEYIGEDEAHLLPSANALSYGINAYLPSLPQWRAFAEKTNTYVLCKNHHYSCYYNHHIYTDGYRYEGRPIGSAYDNDTVSKSLGLSFQPDSDWAFQAILRDINANIDASLITDTSDPKLQNSIAPIGAHWREAELRAEWNWGHWKLTGSALALSGQTDATAVHDRYSMTTEYRF